MFPPNSLARAITDGMKNISDTPLSVLHGNIELDFHVYKVIAEGQPNCTVSAPFFCVIPSFTSYNVIGNTDLNILPSASSIAADEGNLYNVINIFYAAVRLDLGHWTSDNVFTNTTSFKQLIQDTDGANSIFRSITTSKGMAYVNFTTPPSANVPTSSAVIQIPYTCNVMQRKPVGSFIVSVVSATLSMFLGAWGTILAILSAIVRRNPGVACAAHSVRRAARQRVLDSDFQWGDCFSDEGLPVLEGAMTLFAAAGTFAGLVKGGEPFLTTSPFPEVPFDGANASSPPSRITQRTMTIQELSAWVSSAHANVQEIAITDILWWAKRSVLRHQFLVLGFDYAGATYELTIERVGKLVLSPSQTAVDQAEFRVAPAGRDAEFEKKHKLLFGLLTDEKLLPNGYVSHPAFVDFVDHIWRGPRAKLSDIARYAALVRSQEMRYSISRANCYFFARVLFHTIALRHYSLPLLTSSDPLRYFALTTGRKNRSPKLSLNAGVVWKPYESFNRFDPSSTGIVFRFLLHQSDSSSATFWTRFIFIFTIPIILGAAGGAIYGFVKLFGPGVRLPAAFVTEAGRIIFVLIVSVLFFIPVLWAVVNIGAATMGFGGLLGKRLARGTIDFKQRKVLAILEAELPFIQRRGDYTPMLIPTTEKMSTHRRKVYLDYIPVNKTREMPTLWEHEEQVYPEGREEYRAAWELLQTLSADVDNGTMTWDGTLDYLNRPRSQTSQRPSVASLSSDSDLGHVTPTTASDHEVPEGGAEADGDETNLAAYVLHPNLAVKTLWVALSGKAFYSYGY
ncbi:hypothetical protein B0H13DRAFT_2656743 [Mycena leptocephala]|nr:hypothetical protein B0H13DRAFT_2656743 [Mycena leptocephala]